MDRKKLETTFLYLCVHGVCVCVHAWGWGQVPVMKGLGIQTQEPEVLQTQ